ncbi:hypothetical protein B7463_g12561, partial [Scytalidium lignicola]
MPNSSDISRNVEVTVSKGIQPKIYASFNNLNANNNSTLTALVNLTLSSPVELTEEEYTRLLRPDFYQWIQPSDFEVDLLRHQAQLSKNDKDSATWIFDHDSFTRWKSGTDRYLWITGRPGSGKSVIASRLVAKLQEGATGSTNSFLGYAFGSKTDDTKKHASALLRGIIWQLVTWPQLKLDQKRKIVGHFKRSPAILLGSPENVESALLEIFKQYTSMFTHATFIFDGLDECVDIPPFLQQLTRILDNASISFRAIFISQPLSDISAILESKCIVVDMDSNKNRSFTERDILNYVKSELYSKIEIESSRSKFPGQNKSTLILDNLEEIATEITSKANGMFLWAALAIPDILSRFRRSNYDYEGLMGSINKLPELLSNLFEYLLDRITQDNPKLGRSENASRKEHRLILLRWVFHAVRPMTLQELQVAMGLKTDASFAYDLDISTGETPSLEYLEYLARCVFPLVFLQDNRLVLLHATLKEFIQPQQINMQPKISQLLGTSSLVEQIIDVTLQYLAGQEFRFRSCIAIEKSKMSNQKPFYDYSCIAWVSHIKNLDVVPSSLQTLIVKFLKLDNAITWLEQWKHLNAGELTMLQSDLFQAIDALDNPSWCINLLIKCIRMRHREDMVGTQTLKMKQALGRLFKEEGRYEDALNEYNFLYNTEVSLRGGTSLSAVLLQLDMANIYKNQGKYEKALALFEELLVKFRKFGGENGFWTLMVQAHMSGALMSLGRFVEAENLLRKVYEKQRVKFGDLDSATLNTLHNLALCLLSLGKFTEAKPLALQEKKLFTETEGEMGNGVLFAINILACSESALGNHKEALELEQFIWSAWKTRRGRDHPETLTSRLNVADYLSNLGRYDDSYDALNEVVEGYKKIFRDDSPQMLTAMSSMAVNLENKGLYDESLTLTLKTFHSRQEVLGKHHPQTLISMNNLAHLYMRISRWKDAQDLLLQAYDGYCKTLGDGHHRALICLLNIAVLCKDKSSFFQLAKWLAMRIADESKKTSGEMNPTHIRSLVLLSDFQRLLGNWNEALKTVKHASRLSDQLEETHPLSLRAWSIWGIISRDNGDPDDAEDIFQDVCEKEIAAQRNQSENHLRVLRELSLAYRAQGRITDAIDEMTGVYETAMNSLHPESNLLLEFKVDLAVILSDSDQINEAETLAKEALDTFSHKYGRKHDNTIHAMHILGKILHMKGKHDAARILLLDATRARRSQDGNCHPQTLASMEDLAAVLWSQGCSDEAILLGTLVLGGRQDIFGQDHFLSKKTKIALDKMQREAPSTPCQQDLEVAKFLKEEHESLSEKLQIYNEAKEFFGDEHPLTLCAKFEVGIHYQEQGLVTKARDCLETALEPQLRIITETNPATLRTVGALVDISRRSGQTLSNPVLLPSIHWAIKAGNLLLLEQLLEGGADKSVLDKETRLSPLGHAVKNGNIEAVKLLLLHGCLVNQFEESGDTVLHIAALGKHSDLLKLLLENGGDPNIPNSQNQNIMAIASKKGDEITVKELLQLGMEPDRNGECADWRPLHFAAVNGYVVIVELLLNAHADINIKGDKGYTPLLLAAQTGALSVVKVLVDRGADLYTETGDGKNPLHVCCALGKSDTADFLIKGGLNPTKPSRDGLTPAHLAAMNGQVDTLRLLLTENVNVDIRTLGSNLTPLAMAAIHNKIEVVHLLVSYNCDVNTQLTEGLTTLHLVASHGYHEIVQILLKNGAEPDSLSHIGLTPLLAAIENGHTKTVAELLSGGAHLVDGMAVDPLKYALFMNLPDIVELLLDKFPRDLNIKDKETGLTCLHIACIRDMASVVQSLLQRHADPDLQDIEGGTALHIAISRHNTEISSLLISHGAKTDIPDCYGRVAGDWATKDLLDAINLEMNLDAIKAHNSYDGILHKTIQQAILCLRASGKLNNSAQFWKLGRALVFLGDEDNALIAFEQHLTTESGKLRLQCQESLPKGAANDPNMTLNEWLQSLKKQHTV